MSILYGIVVVAVGEVDDAPKGSLVKEVAAYWKEQRGPQYLPPSCFLSLGLLGVVREIGGLCVSPWWGTIGRILWRGMCSSFALGLFRNFL